MSVRITAISLLTAAGLWAAPIATVESGGVALDSQNLGTTGTEVDPWLINETMTSAGIIALTDDDGTPLQSPSAVSPFSSGNWFQKTVINNSGVAWTSFEIELQEILGTPSPDGDGVSFAQGQGLVFSSNIFNTITRIDTTRDYLNFSNGLVAPGSSVTFLFAITDNTPNSPIYINQTPNRADAPGVPEPSSIGLALSGFTVLGYFARRRR